MVDTYIHMGGKVGVLVEAKGEIERRRQGSHPRRARCRSPPLPPWLPNMCAREEVNPEHLEHEKEILIAQARNEGKPEKIIEKMVQGRIEKFYQGSHACWSRLS